VGAETRVYRQRIKVSKPAFQPLASDTHTYLVDGLHREREWQVTRKFIGVGMGDKAALCRVSITNRDVGGINFRVG
jgi:hypothetical protein